MKSMNYHLTLGYSVYDSVFLLDFRVSVLSRIEMKHEKKFQIVAYLLS
jgi:hypothetical protein